MLDSLSSRPRAVAFVLAAASIFGGAFWLYWSAIGRRDINFLPPRSPADWIIYPSGPDLVIRPQVNISTVFTRKLTLQQAPQRAVLSAAGFHDYSILINGKPSGAPIRTGNTWKQPTAYDVTHLVGAGDNEIAVTVSNSNGPSA